MLIERSFGSFYFSAKLRMHQFYNVTRGSVLISPHAKFCYNRKVNRKQEIFINYAGEEKEQANNSIRITKKI